MFRIGQRIKFTKHATPAIIIGKHGTIIGFNEKCCPKGLPVHIKTDWGPQLCAAFIEIEAAATGVDWMQEKI